MQPVCSRVCIQYFLNKALCWHGKQVIATTIFAELFIGMALKSFMPFKDIQEKYLEN